MALTMRELLQKLLSAKKIALFSHTVPDGDAIGSCLALKHFLLANNKRVKIDIFIEYNAQTISPLLRPMLEKHVAKKRRYKKYDLGVALDSPSTNRFEKFIDVFKTAKKTINIDHHDTNTLFADYNVVYPQVSSTCELVYSIAKISKKIIPVETAKYAYIGIITDTACLTQNNISKRTYNVLADISKTGLDLDIIKNFFFKNNTKAKTFLLEKALRSLKFYHDDQVAIMRIKNCDLVELDATDEDTLGIVDHANNIEGVRLAVIFIEKEPNSFYVSLRSKGAVNVAQVAKSLGGGGHNNMAAFQWKGQFKEVLQNLLTSAQLELENPSGTEQNQAIEID